VDPICPLAFHIPEDIAQINLEEFVLCIAMGRHREAWGCYDRLHVREFCPPATEQIYTRMAHPRIAKAVIGIRGLSSSNPSRRYITILDAVAGTWETSDIDMYAWPEYNTGLTNEIIRKLLLPGDDLARPRRKQKWVNYQVRLRFEL
jgi:hypothetical protein